MKSIKITDDDDDDDDDMKESKKQYAQNQWHFW